MSQTDAHTRNASPSPDALPSQEHEVRKEALREQFAAYRSTLDAALYAHASAAIVERLRTWPPLQAAGTVHAYWPDPERREVDIRPLLNDLHAAGTRVVLPVVTSFERGNPAMQHAVFAGEDALTANRWGLLEPHGTARVAPDAFDAVLVPAFGAGLNGHRIGHGFGYYDAFLAALSVPTMVPVYAACLVDYVPAEPHDVAVSAVATEHEILGVPQDQ